MTKKILVIDDDPIVIKSIDRYLKSCGYDIEAAESGKEALEKTKTSDFDLIISDIRMPGMNGIETLKEIRESSLHHNKEKVPAIIITGYAGGDEVCIKAGELGIVEYIYKPFELDEFIEVIRKSLELPPKNKRVHPRIGIAFPVEVIVKDVETYATRKISGETVDLSEGGIGLILEGVLPASSIIRINVNPSPRYLPFQIEALIVWSKPIFKEGYFRCGLHFLKIQDPHLDILKGILTDRKLLDTNFVSLTQEFKEFVQKIKNNFDEFDKVIDKDEQKQNYFIEENKKEIFDKFDDYFAKAWEIVKDLERDRFIIYQNYLLQIFQPLFGENIEINKHIYRKPLGYPGDYMMMNYIYDYNGNTNYLGSSSYEKLINNYTCNIPISYSNIKRKEFLKEKILEVLERKKEAKILSVASGPARELIELLKEGKINKPLLFKCLDFEQRALDFVDNEIKKIEKRKKHLLSIEYICRDVTGIIRHTELKEKLKNQDLIYAVGIFDYLSDRMASRLTKELYQLLQKSGKLVICNASLKNNSHRAYYELLGGWNMVHRREEEMLSWTKDISEGSNVEFEQTSDTNKYLFLSIENRYYE